MHAVLTTLIGLVVAVVIAWSPTTAQARSANTQRIITNATIALDAVTVVEEFASAAIPEKERQTATNLLRDLDYALRRATGDLGRVPAAEQDADVKALQKRVADLQAYRDKVAKNLEASVKGGAELDKRYREYREDSKPYKTAVAAFTLRPGSVQQLDGFTAAVLTAALARLAKLDELCTTKYKGLEFNDRLGFQLGIDPQTDCSVAARRMEIATTIAEGAATNDINSRVKRLDAARMALEANNGYLRDAAGSIDDMVFETEKVTAAIWARHDASFKAIGKTAPADLMAPLTTAVAEVWKEIDRLATTYEFPKKLARDAAAEAGAKRSVASVFDAKVLKSGMQFATWSIAKNEIDIPTEQYRTGTVLVKSKAFKWCQLREFTAHKTYMGGGKYAAAMTFTFGGARFQKCN